MVTCEKMTLDQGWPKVKVRICGNGLEKMTQDQGLEECEGLRQWLRADDSRSRLGDDEGV